MADKVAKKAPVAEKSLAVQLAEKRAELLETKKSLASGELVNPRVIRATRKEVARLLTTINAQKEAK